MIIPFKYYTYSLLLLLMLKPSPEGEGFNPTLTWDNKDCLDLNEQQLATLILAYTGHTGGRKASCITVETCWDADRLDIGRVGIEPDSNYLFGEEAKRIADYKDMDVLRTYREVKLSLADFVLENSQ